MERRRKQSPLWYLFTKKDTEQCIATCKLCCKDLSYKSTLSNLRIHITKTHKANITELVSDSDNEDNKVILNADDSTHFEDSYDNTSAERLSDEEQTEVDGSNEVTRFSRKVSSTLKYFDVIDIYNATCKICAGEVDYDSVSDLTKHLEDHDVIADDELEQETGRRKRSPLWNIFTKKDPDQCIATCKLCRRDLSYRTALSNLKKHIITMHRASMSDIVSESDTNDRVKNVPCLGAWKYYQRLNEDRRIAKCVLCSKVLSYDSTLDSLKLHLASKHSEALIDDSTDCEKEKQLLISTDGQLYEIANSPVNGDAENNDEDGPMEMETVYLEDLDETISEKIQSQEPPKRKFKENCTKKIFPPKIYIQSRSNSDPDGYKKTTNIKNNSSLHLFGDYIVSLLEELPKAVANQLQGDIIKQILQAKIANDCNYTINVNPIANNDDNVKITVTSEVKSDSMNISDQI